jgi:PIN domain nuclease of toxin-antitoxin system
MKLLLDTHTFLWFVAGNADLSKTAIAAIENPHYKKWVSIASLWEISIKTSLGKLNIKGSYESVIDDLKDNGFEILPINFAHTVMQNKLEWHHRDPFDRILVAQAITEQINVLGRDEIFDAYFKKTNVHRLW